MQHFTSFGPILCLAYPELREDERGEEVRMAEAERNEEEKGEKRKREEEKEENETGTVKIRCWRFVSVEAFEMFSQGRDLESCGDLSWKESLEEFENWSDCEPDSCARVRVVPDVPDVPVSTSSVVTEFRDVSSMCSDWEFVEPQSFSFSQKTCTLLYRYAGRAEVRRLTSESASAFKKKDVAANTKCKIRTLPWRGRGSREVAKRKEEDGMREKEQSSQGRNSFWKEVTV